MSQGAIDYRTFGAILVARTPPPPPAPPAEPGGAAPNRRYQRAKPKPTDEFLREVSRLKGALGKRLGEMSDRFGKSDGDGDGRISRREFRDAVAALELTYDHDIVDAVFDGYDFDGSGHIEYGEYMRCTPRGAIAHTHKHARAGIVP